MAIRPRPASPAAQPRPSRRSLFSFASPPNGQSVAQGPLAPRGGATAFDVEAALVQRTSFGVNAELLAEVRNRGFQGYLDWQLDPDNIDDSYLDARLALLPSIHMTGAEIAAAYPNALQYVPSEELRTARALRATLSRRQLFERMVEFWTDHFNVPIIVQKRYLHYLRTLYDRDVIRAHALGSFRDMLHAVARSAGMLKYLDGYRNTAGQVNENFSRELLELMTLGAEGPYDEDDIKELSRAFTGWQHVPINEPAYGDFYFDPALHEPGAKSVLGLNLPSGGEDEASAVLDHLAVHPVVAERISRKLGSWLLGYEPTPSAVAAAKATFLSTGGDIRSVLRTLLSKGRLLSTARMEDRKLKRPLHFGASLLRAAGARFTSLDGVRESFETLGQVSFDWRPPNGYPDAPAAWIWLQYPRLKFATELAQSQLPWADLAESDLLSITAAHPRTEWGEAVLSHLSAGLVRPQEAADLQAYVDSHPGLSDTELTRELLVLAALAPSFQEY